jgi:hypothetical protein
MDRRVRFRLLTTVFYNRFFENDTVSPGGGFQTNIYQVAGFLIATGWFVAYFLTPPMLKLTSLPPMEQTDWAIHTLRLFFTACSFAIVGFAAIFEWDMLFPDRRDFLVLGTLPVPLGEMFAARLAALAVLLAVLVAAFNVFPILMMIAVSIIVPSLRGTATAQAAAQLAATGAAALFALVSVAALQGLLIALLTPRAFARVSPWIQMLGMSAMVLCVMLYPLYSLLLKPALDRHELWPWLLPPAWFAGVYDLVLQPPASRFAHFGEHGLAVLAAAVAAAAVGWGCGYRRYYSRTLENEQPAMRRRPWTWPALFTRSSEERAIAAFTAKTFTRSQKHRLLLATYISVGLSVGCLFALAVQDGRVVVSRSGIRVFPFFIVFFVISGFRALSQFPAELGANWVFRLSEAEWTEAARRAIRKQAVVTGLLPSLALMTPLQFAVWGWREAIVHTAFQLLAGALLVEVFFWRFDKVPFTCPYFAGRSNLALTAGLYIYGFTTYSFNLADLEQLVVGNGMYRFAVFAIGGGLLLWFWLHRNPPSTVRFDADEPAIQPLNLT